MHKDKLTSTENNVLSAENVGFTLKRLKILFVTSEMSDFIKTGGLGEVSAALPSAMMSQCDVRVLLPGYRAVLEKAHPIEVVQQMPGHAGLPPWSLGKIQVSGGLIVYVVLCEELFDRAGTPYGVGGGVDFPDNDVRFARLCRSAAEIMQGAADPAWKPDILHANDWPSALSAGYLKWLGVDAPSILTIHNLAYQGIFSADRLDVLGIPCSAFDLDGVEFHGKLSFLKAGLAYSSHLTTVSQTYAEEITSPAHGCGLDGLLRQRRDECRLHGILNGIDESWFEPAKLADDAEALDSWKQDNAARLRRQFDLSQSSGPLFAIVSRLVHQKGIDLSIEAARHIVDQGGQIVVTGQGEKALEQRVEDLSRRYPGQVSAHIGFDDEEARLMFAGSDFLLMPSRFEPCGLSQMYAQSSAALPIASRTGGLVDTIDDGRSGFLLPALNANAFGRTIARALNAFRASDRLKRMRRHALSKRFSWDDSAQRYHGVYAQALGQ